MPEPSEQDGGFCIDALHAVCLGVIQKGAVEFLGAYVVFRHPPREAARVVFRARREDQVRPPVRIALQVFAQPVLVNRSRQVVGAPQRMGLTMYAQGASRVMIRLPGPIAYCRKVA